MPISNDRWRNSSSTEEGSRRRSDGCPRLGIRQASIEPLELQYFVAVADDGNFARVAMFLGINTSTISRVLAALDRELGRAVFERKHSGARLTEGGKAVLLHVRRALAEMSRSSRRELETALAVLASSASASEYHRPVSPLAARSRPR